MFRMRRMNLFMLTLLTIGFLATSSRLTFAQSATLVSDIPSGSIFLLRDRQLLAVNVFASLQPAVEILEMPLRLETFDPGVVDEWRIAFAELDQTATILYTIEGSGRTERRFPTSTRLVQTNLATGERTVLSDRNGLFTFVLSPDQQLMILGYYEGEYGVARRRSCIFNLVNRDCRDVPLVVGSNPGYWLDNRSYTVFAADPVALRLVNVETSEVQLLSTPPEWFLYSGVPISGARTLLVSARLRTDTTRNASQFLTLNIDTLELRDFAYDALNQNYSGVGIWSFSPDGRYLFYGGGLQMALVEFQTGHLIREFDRVFNSGWIDSTTLVVQGALDTTTGGILRLNAETGEVVPLAATAEAGGILLIP